MAEKHDRSAVLAHRRFSTIADALKDSDLRDRFTMIHEHNLWGSGHSISGLGSEMEATKAVREALPGVFKQFGIRTLLDAPCGDASWIRSADLKLDRYIGIDIVPSLIEDLSASARAHERFVVADITCDHLPQSDAVLCRDCLVHLSFENIYQALVNFRSSGARWLLTTTFPELVSNVDCEDGDWRGLNFQQLPFAWPAPLMTLSENCTEGDGSWSDKSLAVWDLTAL